MKILNNILNYKNLKIYQNTTMFSFSLDSVLLARFYKPKKKDINICDFGTNNAIIPLILSKYIDKNSMVYGVEIQKQACETALENIELNNLTQNFKIINQDIKEFIKEKNNFFDVIYSNPPFFKNNKDSKHKLNDPDKTTARHEVLITMEEIIISAKIGLKNGGRLVMIHLIERMDELIYKLWKNKFRIKKLQIVYSKLNQDAKKILIEAVNDGNEGMKLLKPLIVHNHDGSYTKEIEEMFGD